MAGDSEKAILGCLLNSPATIPTTVETLKPTDLLKPSHAAIYQAIITLWRDGNPVDPITTASELDRRGDLDRVGGALYLHDLTVTACMPASIDYHTRLVVEAARRWRLKQAGARIAQLADSDAPLSEIDHIIQQQLLESAEDDVDSPRLITEGIDELLDGLSDGATARGLPSGFAELDDITGGFRPGQMVIMAARPGVGKSTLAVDIMRELSLRGRIPTLLFSLEMSRAEVQERIISAESDVLLSKLRGTMPLDEGDWERIGDHRDKLTDAPMLIDDSPRLTMLDIIAKSRAAVQCNGVQLIVVDYLQLLKSGTKAESRQAEVSEISRQLKLLAKQLKVPIIAIAQLNRGVESRGDDALPRASDLRESGSLEQDADMVLLIHRPDATNPDHERAGEADVIVAKNRGGRVSTATVANQLHFARFSDYRAPSFRY
ncbi:DnaB-like helicase C-terminal domain-containing protein [Corynebacterium heidelbergense]|uniref:DNA 5'-3' helicase n=1 Tax=Corynebacterium heidelbergense TaxID=2055947 RepID=A0A364VEA7_9CORY|nr:DnaB-like helicase C-terminal domain-containing protein [Corynebacterium heidelbergense]RAV34896.1 replicative DNA helicase [Corynebacterium heidelbergense]WCZ36032.1 Replicative DNA helicase [Corynebacterium heidelbergense]